MFERLESADFRVVDPDQIALIHDIFYLLSNLVYANSEGTDNTNPVFICTGSSEPSLVTYASGNKVVLHKINIIFFVQLCMVHDV